MIPGVTLYKAPPVSNDVITVTAFGEPKRPFRVYLYADLLEELQYNAKTRAARGILTGRLHIVPSDMRLSTLDKSGQNKNHSCQNPQTAAAETAESQAIPDPVLSPVDYIEVMSFKDVFPVQHALDYAGYLRRMRDFRTVNEDSVILGSVSMAPQMANLMLEDLILQRSYFAAIYQIALFVESGSKRPRLYMLDDDAEQFVESGYFIIHAKDEPLAFA